jgi:hypothetical protein
MVARARAALTVQAMVVGALQLQGAEHTGEGLCPPPGKPGRLAARANSVGPRVVRMIGVEVALNGGRRQTQRFAAGSGLDRFEVQGVGGFVAYEPADFLADLRRQRLCEPPFLAASVEAA